jgi:hypothetical protein
MICEPQNNEMKRTKSSPGGTSPLISVFSRHHPPMTEPAIISTELVAGRVAGAGVEFGRGILVAHAGSLRRVALSGQHHLAISVVDSRPNDSGRTKRRENNEMKRTKSSPRGTSPLISVFCGPSVSRRPGVPCGGSCR